MIDIALHSSLDEEAVRKLGQRVRGNVVITVHVQPRAGTRAREGCRIPEAHPGGLRLDTQICRALGIDDPEPTLHDRADDLVARQVLVPDEVRVRLERGHVDSRLPFGDSRGLDVEIEHELLRGGDLNARGEP